MRSADALAIYIRQRRRINARSRQIELHGLQTSGPHPVEALLQRRPLKNLVENP